MFDILFEPVRSGHLKCHALRFRLCKVGSCDATSYGCVTITIITLRATEELLQHWPLMQFTNGRFYTRRRIIRPEG